MNRRIPVLLAVLLLAGVPSLHSQNYPTSSDQSESVDGQQNSSGTCPDGSSATSLGDGSVGCPSTQLQDQTSPRGGAVQEQGNRSSVSSQAESANISGQTKNQNSLQNRQLPPEPLSEFQKFVAGTTGQLLPIYGANLFRNVPATFSPNDLAPVSSDYILGPDDELRIRIWGQVSYSGNLRVDRSGDIYIPVAGAVHVAGLPFSALDQHLREALGKVYRNFDLSVDMGRIRSMQIYVTGQARRPGVYTVSSLSSLVDALFASGGPSAQGSLRHIELRRGGKTITDFDLYALLIRGDKSGDAKLLPEDVLYIPPVGGQVAVTGSVHSPAIYELRGNETIGDLIDAAGKTTTIASSGRISLERTGEHQLREAMEFPFDSKGLATPLAGGDIVRVYSIVSAYQKTVTLRGDVANPGRFAWHEGMHLSELIPDKDSLMSRDYWWKRSHLGLPTPEFEPFLSDFEVNLKKTNRNGNYPCNPYANVSNSNLYDTSNTSLNETNSNTTCITSNSNQNTNSQQQPNLDPTSPEAQQELSKGLAASQRQDVNEYNENSNESQISRQSTTGGGSVGSQLGQLPGPGGVMQTQRTEVRLSAPEIDWNYAVIERLDPETLKTSLISFDLGKLVLNHEASQNLELQPGDVISVFSQADIRVPLEEQTKYVKLEGEFVHAGVYSVKPGETLHDLVRRAGGFSNKAYLYGSEFNRESTRILQQQRIDEYVRRVDLDASRGTLALTASPASSTGSVTSATAATAAERELLLRLKQIRATGRVVLNFRSDSANIDDVPEISLENGDRFTVPPAPATINVVGAVYDQNSFLFHNGGEVGQYLRVAGGPDRDADWRRTFVIRADGSVVSRDSVKGPWGNTFKDMKLYAGDTIVVPDKTLRPTALRGLLDWTQIFSQLAIGAAAVEVLK
jgi:protein involved in polysaccharide export with SLBB domain